MAGSIALVGLGGCWGGGDAKKERLAAEAAERVEAEDATRNALALLEQERLEDALPELRAGAESRSEDVEAQLLAALAAASQEEDALSWEMLERARLAGGLGDASLVEAVEERLAEGAAAARAFLVGEMAPSAFRERLGERP